MRPACPRLYLNLSEVATAQISCAFTLVSLTTLGGIFSYAENMTDLRKYEIAFLDKALEVSLGETNSLFALPGPLISL